jgi:hypothetical protein
VADKLMTITTDSAELLRAIDRLPAVVQAKCKARAHVTAQRIAREARARVRRRTGRLAGSIEVREDYARVGYVVGTFLQPKVGIALHRRRSGRRHTQKVTRDNLPIWVEFGTTHVQARPFLLNSARLEAAGHERGIHEAIREAIADSGLGS